MPATNLTRMETGPASELESLPNDIPVALKSVLVDDRGVSYREFRRTLTPRYWRIWLQIGLGWMVLAAIPAVLAVWNPEGFGNFAWSSILGAFAIGYVLAYLNNFFHEAAHHLLLPDRRRNDVATNLVLGSIFGSSIQRYRLTHWQHHRALGTTMDSEVSYFDPLSVSKMIEGLTGIRALRAMRRYRDVEVTRNDDPAASDRGRLLWAAGTAALHMAIAAALWLGAGSAVAGLAWIAGVIVTFPFFIALRQTLEHRSEEASGRVDYHTVDQGATTRLFGDGPVACTLGSAGFNRHALHHWEPQLSYTRLKDLERYLRRTQIGEAIEARRTTYADTFVRLLEL